MSIEWCKLFHDFADDVKFLRVAEMTGSTVELAQACFARAMCRASSNPDRGSLAGVDFEEFAWWFSKPVELRGVREGQPHDQGRPPRQLGQAPGCGRRQARRGGVTGCSAHAPLAAKEEARSAAARDAFCVHRWCSVPGDE